MAWRRKLANLLTSEGASRAWSAAASIVTIITLPLVLLQVWDLGDQHSNREVQILLSIDQQLVGEKNAAIRHRIRRRQPLLERAGGPFTREELGDYLDVLEGLASMEARKLVRLDELDDWHGYTITVTYRHPEILPFIREERHGDPENYAGFEDLGRRITGLARTRGAPPETTITSDRSKAR